MKNNAIIETIVVPKNSTWSVNEPPYLYEPTSFDAGDRNFRDDRGTPLPEAVITGAARLIATEILSNKLGPTIWHGVRVTLPIPPNKLCWAPYSIGDVIVDEREPDFPISNKIVSIEVRITAESADLIYIFPNRLGMDHQYVCEGVNEGRFRIIVGGGQGAQQ